MTDRFDLLKAVTVALDAAGAVWTGDLFCQIDNTRQGAAVRLAVSGTAFASILWADGGTTFPSHALGFTSNTASGTSFVSTQTPTGMWVCSEPPSRDDHGIQRLVSQSIAQDGTVTTVVRGDIRRTRALAWGEVDPTRTFITDGSTDAWESWLVYNGDGRTVEVHSCPLLDSSDTHALAAASASVATADAVLSPMTLSTRLDGRSWTVASDSLEQWSPRRLDAGVNLFAWAVSFLEAI